MDIVHVICDVCRNLSYKCTEYNSIMFGTNLHLTSFVSCIEHYWFWYYILFLNNFNHYCIFYNSIIGNNSMKFMDFKCIISEGKLPLENFSQVCCCEIYSLVANNGRKIK